MEDLQLGYNSDEGHVVTYLGREILGEVCGNFGKLVDHDPLGSRSRGNDEWSISPWT